MVKPVIGAHVSAAGGFPNAVLLARHIGAEAIQLFGSSPRQWAIRPPALREAAVFQAAVRDAGLRGVFLHAPYLVNLGTPDDGLWKRSVALLAATMKTAMLLGARGVVVHLGSGESGLFRSQSLARAVAGVKQVLRQAPLSPGAARRSGEPLLLIENAAGGGEKIGRDLPEIAWLIQKIASKRVGVCFDTAHAFEAGIVSAYDDDGVAMLAAAIQETVGWERLKVIHANDSKTAFNSKHDRHENIGKGYIGTDGFRTLLAHPKFRALPFILEVPGFDGAGPDKKNVDILRRLCALA